MKIILRLFICFSLLLVVAGQASADNPKIRVGVLKFGTVNWALKVIQEKEFDQAEGIELEIIPLANKNATNVALQGGAVDTIVSDWIWVSRQRTEGRNYTFAPYSLAVGSVMVRPEANIKSVPDLKGKRLGVAGGPVDKSWLLLRAYSQKTFAEDIAELVQPNFAAPPLLNKLMAEGDLDAVLNFWHFAARLKASGNKTLIEVSDILPALGVEGDLPLLGWVFADAWIAGNRATADRFLRAARKATVLMQQDDALWDTFLRPLTKAKDDNTLLALRDGFRAGVPAKFGADEQKAAAQVFLILAEQGGEKLVGRSTLLAPGTFLAGYSF